MDNSSLRHADNRKKDILVLIEGLTGGLDDTTITEAAKYYFNISKSIKRDYLVYTTMLPMAFCMLMV